MTTPSSVRWGPGVWPRPRGAVATSAGCWLDRRRRSLTDICTVAPGMPSELTLTVALPSGALDGGDQGEAAKVTGVRRAYMHAVQCSYLAFEQLFEVLADLGRLACWRSPTVMANTSPWVSCRREMATSRSAASTVRACMRLRGVRWRAPAWPGGGGGRVRRAVAGPGWRWLRLCQSAVVCRSPEPHPRWREKTQDGERGPGRVRPTSQRRRRHSMRTRPNDAEGAAERWQERSPSSADHLCSRRGWTGSPCAVRTFRCGSSSSDSSILGSEASGVRGSWRPIRSGSSISLGAGRIVRRCSSGTSAWTGIPTRSPLRSRIAPSARSSLWSPTDGARSSRSCSLRSQARRSRSPSLSPDRLTRRWDRRCPNGKSSTASFASPLAGLPASRTMTPGRSPTRCTCTTALPSSPRVT